jgi:hypothetical protein
MPTYYELLKIEKNASQNEIEAKLDDQYTKWRGLVTHHDPNVVDQAQQALALMEEMRSILLNPDKRATYDKAIASQREGLAGLADPDMILAANPMQGGGMAPPRPRQPRMDDERKLELDRTDAWLCQNPQCKKANQIGTQFCAKCGSQIGYECPKCGGLVELANKFCSFCGVDKQKHFNHVQQEVIQELQKEIARTSNDLNLAESNPLEYAKRHPAIVDQLNGCLSGFVFISLLGLGIAIGAASESAFLGAIIGLGLPLALIIIMSVEHKKSQVAKYAESTLKKNLRSQRDQLNVIKKAKYGDTNKALEAYQEEQRILDELNALV